MNMSSLFCFEYQSVQSLSRVRLSVNPWTVARQASLSITNSQSLLKLMSIESVMPVNHLILCHPHLLLPSIFPSTRVFSSQSVLHISGQSIGVSASTLVLPMNIFMNISVCICIYSKYLCHSPSPTPLSI